jgi:hypothetical protein
LDIKYASKEMMIEQIYYYGDMTSFSNILTKYKILKGGRKMPLLRDMNKKMNVNNSILKTDLYEKFNCTNGREII